MGKTASAKRTISAKPVMTAEKDAPLQLGNWTHHRSLLLLVALTLVCLIPFCAEAFHVDDPLFLWAAQQIVKHPLDPYGFSVVWYWKSSPMAEITQNPPLASYYLAGVGNVVGSSEVALHLAFLLPALIVVLGTYQLARRFTGSPLFAAAATLLTPGFLVSSTSVMCDTMMLAAWILAVLLWMKGLDRNNPAMLAASGLVIAFCALSKYFGMALIPLLLVYTIARQRRVSSSALFLLIPVLALAGYQHWTHQLYGKGLLFQAADYATHQKVNWTGQVAKSLVGLTFAGGCALPILLFTPFVWRRRSLLFGTIAVVIAAFCCAMSWVNVANFDHVQSSRAWLGLQLGLFLAGGASVIALAVADWWKRKDAGSLLLGLWVLGTFFFAAFVNWTVNARSVLPLIPAAAILLARRLDLSSTKVLASKGLIRRSLPLAVSGALSLWVTWADFQQANAQRTAAEYVREHCPAGTKVNFEGHWGFQYYMERFGFHPIEPQNFHTGNGDVAVIPENNTNTFSISKQFIASESDLTVLVDAGASTMNFWMGAGFYTDAWGPLPYAFGNVPPERYALQVLKIP